MPGAAAGLLRLHEEYGPFPGHRPGAGHRLRRERLPRPSQRGGQRKPPTPQHSAEFPGHARHLPEARRDPTPRRRHAGAEGLRQHPAGHRQGRARRLLQGGDRPQDRRRHGGPRRRRDPESLEDYRAEDATIVRGSYRGYDIVGMDVPSAGVLVIQALQIMENFDPHAMTEAQWAAVKGQALGIASRELRGLGSDTARARATSKAWARRMATTSRHPGALMGGADAGSAAWSSAGPCRPARPARRPRPHHPPDHGRQTRHVRVPHPDAGPQHGLQRGDPGARVPVRRHPRRVPGPRGGWRASPFQHLTHRGAPGWRAPAGAGRRRRRTHPSRHRPDHLAHRG